MTDRANAERNKLTFDQSLAGLRFRSLEKSVLALVVLSCPGHFALTKIENRSKGPVLIGLEEIVQRQVGVGWVGGR